MWSLVDQETKEDNSEELQVKEDFFMGGAIPIKGQNACI